MERRKPDELKNFPNATKQCECTFSKQKAEYVGNDMQGAAAAAVCSVSFVLAGWLFTNCQNTQMTVGGNGKFGVWQSTVLQSNKSY